MTSLLTDPMHRTQSLPLTVEKGYIGITFFNSEIERFKHVYRNQLDSLFVTIPTHAITAQQFLNGIIGFIYTIFGGNNSNSAPETGGVLFLDETIKDVRQMWTLRSSLRFFGSPNGNSFYNARLAGSEIICVALKQFIIEKSQFARIYENNPEVISVLKAQTRYNSRYTDADTTVNIEIQLESKQQPTTITPQIISFSIFKLAMLVYQKTRSRTEIKNNDIVIVQPQDILSFIENERDDSETTTLGDFITINDQSNKSTYFENDSFWVDTTLIQSPTQSPTQSPIPTIIQSPTQSPLQNKKESKLNAKYSVNSNSRPPRILIPIAKDHDFKKYAALYMKYVERWLSNCGGDFGAKYDDFVSNFLALIGHSYIGDADVNCYSSRLRHLNQMLVVLLSQDFSGHEHDILAEIRDAIDGSMSV